MLLRLARFPLSRMALAALSLFAGRQALAQAVTPTGQQVEITAKPQQVRERQDDIGLRSTYGREEIDKYGDTNLSEVLKRLPGISVTESKGKGAEIRMRGLGNGYTQILLNGQATPNGFTIDSIAPDLIEKIEVMRVAGADVSAQSIAGTINIVLKKKSGNQSTEIKSSAGLQSGRLSGNASWSIADHLPVDIANQADINYVFAGSIESNTNDVNGILREGQYTLSKAGQWQTLADRQLQQTQQNRRDAISLTPRLNWKIDAQNSLNWQAYLNYARPENAKHEKETTLEGSSTDFPDNRSIWAAHILTSRNDLNWEHRLADSAKLNINWGWNHFDRDAKFQFWGNDSKGVQTTHRYVTGDANENEYRFSGKYLAPYSENHVLSLGWDSSRSARTEGRDEADINIATGDITPDSHHYQASLVKLAAYIQDEWTINTAWSAYLGLRWERITSNSREAGEFDFSNRSTMLSPILQSVWKLDAKRQWRFALNRSFKLPTVFNLIPRRFRIDNNNTPLNADFQGNPQLRPERAWGLDVAYEHYLTESSLISVNTYWRRIQDVMLERLTKNGTTWLTSMSNSGGAKVIGLEVEIKTKLQELSPTLPPVELRANLNRNWSSVDQVPGPNNRLAHQTGLLISTGADYQINPAWRTGADFSFQAADQIRESDNISTHTGPKRNLDIYLSWKQSKQSQWRFSVTNVLQQDRLASGDYTENTERWTDAGREQSARTWRVVWELRL
ncbi:TonB-dependent receptor [Undibacterium sp. CY18W]|uniref:TonB-dependent receptor n=1 Tax=Undibacterium hunanense TaxID=2762292 RepID=A0ABR6ZX63_9BURK|nr:TonB-dependent receptor [Undibacterium hunanense]MBC3920450.1 TonB-dependent receptor [Undibacterium hunanense]